MHNSFDNHVVSTLFISLCFIYFHYVFLSIIILLLFLFIVILIVDCLLILSVVLLLIQIILAEVKLVQIIILNVNIHYFQNMIIYSLFYAIISTALLSFTIIDLKCQKILSIKHIFMNYQVSMSKVLLIQLFYKIHKEALSIGLLSKSEYHKFLK